MRTAKPESSDSCRRTDSGFTMVEILVAMVIFLIVVAAAAPMLQNQIRLAGSNTSRVAAANVAQQTLDQLRHSDGAARPLGRSTRSLVINGVTYQVTADLRWISAGASAGSCDGGGGTTSQLAYIRADVTVEWANMQATPVTSSTLIRPNKVAGANSGTIAVKVTRAGGLPNPGHTVTLSKPDSTTPESQTTDRDGCAFFSNLPLGSYLLSLNTAGYPSTSNGVSLLESAPSGRWDVEYNPTA